MSLLTSTKPKATSKAKMTSETNVVSTAKARVTGRARITAKVQMVSKAKTTAKAKAAGTVRERVTAKSNKKYACRCSRLLSVPPEAQMAHRQGSEIGIVCDSCHYLTIVENFKIVAQVPPRKTTRFTETFY